MSDPLTVVRTVTMTLAVGTLAMAGYGYCATWSGYSPSDEVATAPLDTAGPTLLQGTQNDANSLEGRIDGLAERLAEVHPHAVNAVRAESDSDVPSLKLPPPPRGPNPEL